MADNANVKAQFNALVRENWSNIVYDTLFNKMPFVGLMLNRYGDKKDGRGVGIPDSGALFTGVPGIQKQEVFSALKWQPMSVYQLPPDSEGKLMTFGASTPDLPVGGPEERVKRPSFGWVFLDDPCKVDQDRINHTTRTAGGETNGWAGIQSLVDMENKQRMGVHLTRWDKLFHGTYSGSASGVSTTGAPSSETAEMWDAPHSFSSIASASNTYGGIDRTVSGNEFWKGNTVDAKPAIFREMLRYAKYRMPLGDGTLGLEAKGGKIDALLVGGTLFDQALYEAEQKQAVLINAEKRAQMGLFGFKQDMVQIDDTLVVYDPSQPASTATGLNLDTFVLAIHPDYSLKMTTPKYLGDRPNSKRCLYWNIETKLLTACLAPNIGIVHWTNLT